MGFTTTCIVGVDRDTVTVLFQSTLTFPVPACANASVADTSNGGTNIAHAQSLTKQRRLRITIVLPYGIVPGLADASAWVHMGRSIADAPDPSKIGCTWRDLARA
jgi:hypothetical protein